MNKFRVVLLASLFSIPVISHAEWVADALIKVPSTSVPNPIPPPATATATADSPSVTASSSKVIQIVQGHPMEQPSPDISASATCSYLQYIRWTGDVPASGPPSLSITGVFQLTAAASGPSSANYGSWKSTATASYTTLAPFNGLFVATPVTKKVIVGKGVQPDPDKGEFPGPNQSVNATLFPAYGDTTTRSISYSLSASTVGSDLHKDDFSGSASASGSITVQ